jgi:catechol 2,3-dioxygenase-like lactoylglutathione lyase family enzyme
MTSSRPVVKQLDHVVARVDDPRAVFKAFTETLGLPVAWPLASYPAFESGGVALGNLYLEIMQCGPRRGASNRGRLCAVVFESPGIEGAAEELSRRGVPHTPAAPYVERGEGGARAKIWTNVVLGRLVGRDILLDATITLSRLPGAARMSDAGAGGWFNRFQLDALMRRNLVFLVEYHYENFGERPFWSEFGDHEHKRAQDSARLHASGGGALGLERVREVVVGVRDFPAARALWSKLYAPAAEVSSGVWEIDDGPALRLVESDTNSIQALALRVASLERAETHLHESGMIGTVADDEITIAPEKIEGLRVRLVR